MRNPEPNDRGAILVIFAVILPVLILLFYGLVEVGLRIQTENQLDTATERGVAVGIVNWGESDFDEDSLAGVVDDLSVAGKEPEIVVLYPAEDAGGTTPWADDPSATDPGPLGCVSGFSCIRYELQSDSTWLLTVEGFSELDQPECEDGLLGLAATTTHVAFTPLAEFGAPNSAKGVKAT